MKVVLLGSDGKVGSGSGRRSREAGHERVELDADADAAVDFTRPRRSRRTCAGALEDGVPVVVGTTGLDQERVDAVAREQACRSSTRRTSRSAPC